MYGNVLRAGSAAPASLALLFIILAAALLTSPGDSGRFGPQPELLLEGGGGGDTRNVIARRRRHTIPGRSGRTFTCLRDRLPMTSIDPGGYQRGGVID